jgi:hypothetical protein
MSEIVVGNGVAVTDVDGFVVTSLADHPAWANVKVLEARDVHNVTTKTLRRPMTPPSQLPVQQPATSALTEKYSIRHRDDSRIKPASPPANVIHAMSDRV